jgi:hypothetical protein
MPMPEADSKNTSQSSESRSTCSVAAKRSDTRLTLEDIYHRKLQKEAIARRGNGTYHICP